MRAFDEQFIYMGRYNIHFLGNELHISTVSFSTKLNMFYVSNSILRMSIDT